MLNSSGPVAKLYMSIIDDVIDGMRELFFDEGLEDRVLDDLKHLWETKMMQSKAMEDYRKNYAKYSNFVLQLPANYKQPDQDAAAAFEIPASKNIYNVQVQNSSETVATFSLPHGLTYPVQIPAGVTLQTASGQLYKVNVPVVVTQAPGGQQPGARPSQVVDEGMEAAAPQSAAPLSDTILTGGVEPGSNPAFPQEIPPYQPPAVPDVTPAEHQPTNQSEPVDLSLSASPCTQLLDHQISAEEALMQTGQSRDIDDILKQVIEEEREKVEREMNRASGEMCGKSGATLGLDLDYAYSALSDIVQLDGPADNSDLEEDGRVCLEENDFLGLINAEAINALQGEIGSSDSDSSSSSDGEQADEFADVVEEDPLNSGDDVVEQDILDLFDTDNVIVCQYDKIHRSKNRWKFHLKDGVISYEGRDYVFSKAVGEAEW